MALLGLTLIGLFLIVFVMVGGHWVVRDRVHVAEAPVRAAFAKTMKRLEETL